jgi:hypothetical protein
MNMTRQDGKIPLLAKLANLMEERYQEIGSNAKN